MSETQPSAVGARNGDLRSPGPADRFLEHLAESLGGKASVTVVYGEPIERGGITVIPVARVRLGIGGGAGSGEGSGQGSGAGGGVSASPVGYIEIANGRTTFRRIHDPLHLLVLAPVILATGVSLGLILRALQSFRQARSHGPLGGLQRPARVFGRLRRA